METALVSVVVDGFGLAFGVGVGVGTTDYDDVTGLVLLVEDLLQFTVLVTGDAVLGFKAGKREIAYLLVCRKHVLKHKNRQYS